VLEGQQLEKRRKKIEKKTEESKTTGVTCCVVHPVIDFQNFSQL
jgi:hypothetical protein